MVWPYGRTSDRALASSAHQDREQGSSGVRGWRNRLRKGFRFRIPPLP